MYTNTTLQWALSKPENKISGISIVCVCILMMQVDLIHQFKIILKKYFIPTWSDIKYYSLPNIFLLKKNNKVKPYFD